MHVELRVYRSVLYRVRYQIKYTNTGIMALDEVPEGVRVSSAVIIPPLFLIVAGVPVPLLNYCGQASGVLRD